MSDTRVLRCCDEPDCRRTQPIMLWHSPDEDQWFFVLDYVATDVLGATKLLPIERHKVPVSVALLLDEAFPQGGEP